MKPDAAMRALPKLLFGGEFFHEHDEMKRALLVDALCLLLVLLGLAMAARGQSQEQKPNQNQQTNSQSQSQAPSSAPNAAPGAPSTPAQKNPPDKKKHVYTEEDLAGIKGGVSVVGDPNAAPSQSNTARHTSGEATGDADSGNRDEKYWRDRAAQIHAQMDSLDQQIKDLQADIQKNGAAGFDPQKGLKDNIIYVDDKNARLQQFQKKRADLEHKLDDLQEEGRKAGIPSSWVR